LLALVCASAGAVADEGTIQVKPDGTIEIKEWTVGFLLGGQEGNGTLKFRGKSYPLKISGIHVGATGGIARASLTGHVYGLRKAQDIAGAYGAGEAEVALIGGPKIFVLRNKATNVVVRLKGEEEGLDVALALGGMNISLK